MAIERYFIYQAVCDRCQRLFDTGMRDGNTFRYPEILKNRLKRCHWGPFRGQGLYCLACLEHLRKSHLISKKQ